MEWLGKLFAIFLMLTVVSVLMAVLKAIGFWSTGKTKALPSKVDPTNSVTPSVLLAPEPLKPKDSRKKAETSEQSVFITKYKSPNKEILQSLTTKTCSIHNKKCIGLVIIDW